MKEEISVESLNYKIVESSINKSGHVHSYAHILLPLKSRMVVRYSENTYNITSQQLCFVPPNYFHHCWCLTEIVQINIPSYMINNEDINILKDHPILPIEGVLIPLTNIIKEEVQKNPDSSSIRYLYYYLYEKLVETQRIKSVQYIQEHFDEPITLEQLAELENYNITYFCEWFKKKIGFSPSDYIRYIRIQKAKNLIQTTNYRIIDIALQVGYNNHSSFSRAFKNIEGISPLKYKRQIN